MLEGGHCEHFEPEDRRHRRGNFPAASAGVTRGMGSPALTNPSNEAHRRMAQGLFSDADAKRLATFASVVY